jgi:hypothetical protein
MADQKSKVMVEHEAILERDEVIRIASVPKDEPLRE